MYHYAGNNPVKYTDPDGRLYGLPREAQKKIQERVVNNSINYNDYNHIQQAKAGAFEFPHGKLTQKVNGVTKYGTACIYFSVVNACLMSGMKPDGFIPPDLSTFVDKKRGNYTDLLKTIFGVGSVYHEIPSGLNEAQLQELIGNNPAVLIYDQQGFWGNDSLSGVHGIAYFEGNLHEPFTGRQGSNFNTIKGFWSKPEYLITNYLRGFYMEIKNDEE